MIVADELVVWICTFASAWNHASGKRKRANNAKKVHHRGLLSFLILNSYDSTQTISSSKNIERRSQFVHNFFAKPQSIAINERYGLGRKNTERALEERSERRAVIWHLNRATEPSKLGPKPKNLKAVTFCPIIPLVFGGYLHYMKKNTRQNQAFKSIAHTRGFSSHFEEVLHG